MLGLGSSLVKGGFSLLSYVKDGLKLFMPYKKGDGALQFVGTGSTAFVEASSQYINFGDVCNLGSTTDFTITCWAKSTNWVNEYIIAKWYNTNNRWGMGTDGISGGRFVFTSEGSSSTGIAYTGSSLAAYENQWVHLTIVADRSINTKGYINGILDDTDTGTDPDLDLDNDGNLTIGFNDEGDRYFGGNIKNVAIWNRALTATEIQNVMYKQYDEIPTSSRLTDGLVSWWALDSSTDTYKDSHGSNDGTNSGSTLQDDIYGGYSPVIPRAIDNAPTVQADAIGSGSALFVGGSGDKIVIADDSTLDITDTISICLWVKPTQQRWQGIIDKGALDGVASGDYSIYLNNASPAILQFGLNGASRATTSAAIPLNEWTHIACTYDKDAGGEDEAKVYLNGVLSKEGNYSTVIATSSTALNLGIYLQAYSLSGNLCQVGIWDAVLDQAQIQSVMEKTYEELTASEKEDLVSYWALDVDASDSHGDNDGTLT